MWQLINTGSDLVSPELPLASISKIENLQEKGYEIEYMKVNFMVYWYKQDTQQEVLIILSEIFFTEKKIPR